MCVGGGGGGGAAAVVRLHHTNDSSDMDPLQIIKGLDELCVSGNNHR